MLIGFVFNRVESVVRFSSAIVSQRKRGIRSSIVEETLQELLMPHCKSDVASFTQSVGHAEMHLRSALMRRELFRPSSKPSVQVYTPHERLQFTSPCHASLASQPQTA